MVTEEYARGRGRDQRKRKKRICCNFEMLDIYINMNNTIKQFALLVSNFVERSLIPLLDTKLADNLKAIDQWNTLKSMMVDQEPIEIWKI